MNINEWSNIHPSAWKGHRPFANWIVNRLQPEVIVELGVDWGHSSSYFSEPQVGHIYSIDTWAPEHSPGGGAWEHAEQIQQFLREQGNITPMQEDLNEAAKVWDKDIDILHIDAFHHYDAVKNDFEKWSGFVREGGVILFHDTISFRNDVGRFFDEIEGMHKCNFHHSAGLGVASTDEALINEIKSVFDLL